MPHKGKTTSAAQPGLEGRRQQEGRGWASPSVLLVPTQKPHPGWREKTGPYWRAPQAALSASYMLFSFFSPNSFCLWRLCIIH